MIYQFNTNEASQLSKIGGKAKALIETSKAGFPVPEGIVLSVEFFEPWLKEIKATNEWRNMIKDTTKETCDLVLGKALSMGFDNRQSNAFAFGLKDLSGDVFAVRSSSPEEDLEDTSFAGMYETFLGVRKNDLQKAVAKAFASCFDYRVMAYKKQNGLNLEGTCIAVVVQRQIASDVSGVGFSLNPLNNDHDEAVINANFGLGESVVSGAVSPDQFIINKVKNEIIEKILGGHEVVISLDVDSGVVVDKSRREGFSLNDEKVLEITHSIKKIEELYGFPVDIEWAFEGDELYILQARPITAYIPLEPHMMTAIGEQRMLYMDMNLVDALTSNQPILPLTLDWFYGAFTLFIGPIFGDAKINAHLPVKDTMVFGGSGRAYANLSQMLHLTKLEKVMAAGEQADQQLVAIAQNIDDKKYKMNKPLPYLKKGYLLWNFPKWMWRSRKLISKTIRAYTKPNKFYEREFKINVDEAIKKLKSGAYKDVPLTKITEVVEKDLDNVIFNYTFSPIVPLMMSMDKIPKLLKDGTEEMDELADAIFLGTDDNETIELGIQLYNMAKSLKKSDFDDLDALAKKIEKREMSNEFMQEWDRFILIYKYRGPNELELSNPRYGDNPRLALQQMSYMVESDYNPEQSKKDNIQKRERAYAKICTKLKGRKLKKFKTNYNIATLYSKVRDTPKYMWLLENGIVRDRALIEGQAFVDCDKIDVVEDIFYLYFSEIDNAHSGGDIDLRKIVNERRALYKKLDRIDSYPLFMDSRGRVMAAKAKDYEDGAIKGNGISRGVKTGRIKVLKYPTEKPIEKGDVLVTYTTDPGWTPLFVNVEAIILQIGGPLQHGGVVAREYGKPCVAGIAGVYEIFHDGQIVEVDGTNGVVRIIK
jgi:phosphohistidine swiveling domain-containing protein